MKFTFPPESKPLDGYTIKRAIQRGGFGEVYYALSDGGKEVALKLLQQNMEVELRGVSQCMNLKHPNLVTIFDIKTDAEGDQWIVMEYVSGRGLDDVIAQHSGPMPIDEIKHWLAGISTGLDFLHDRGIVHRDLKPANVYLENGVVKIGDVGLAKFISESRRSAQTQSVGTVYYMAPEVAHGRYGREVDVYSLGVVLYEMLTGCVPFDGESTAEILMKHLSEKPDLTPIPVRLQPVLAQALEKDPQHRTPGAARLATDFENALLGFQIAAAIPDESFLPSDRSAIDEPPAENVPRNPAAGPSMPLPYPGTSTHKEAWKDARREHHEARKTAKERRKQIHDEAKYAHKVELEAAKHAYKMDRVARSAAASAPQPAVRGNARSQGTRPPHQPTHQRASMGRTERQDSSLPKLLAIGVLIFFFGPMLWSMILFGRIWAVLLFAAFAYAAYRFFLYVTHPVGFRPPRGHVAEPPSSQGPPGHDSVLPAEAPIFKAHETPDPAASAVRMRPVARSLHPAASAAVTRGPIALRDRMTELTGSLTIAVVCSAVLTAGLGAATALMPAVEHAVLFGLTTLLAAWAILTLSKLCEGTGVDTFLLRSVLMVVGGFVGAGAYWLSEMLMVDLHSGRYIPWVPAFDTVFSHRLFEVGLRTDPTLAGYTLFFALLFVARPWWRHTDSLRKKRFRLISVLLTVAIALLLSIVWAFPQTWAIAWAAAIASVVQLSAVWVPPEQRSSVT
jgi:serine/threonine protein kinase